MEHVKFISISSGGARAVTFIGALKALKQHYGLEEHLPNIVGFAGCSAGAIIAMCLCIGFTIDELYQQLELLSFDAIAPEFDISLFLHDYGLNSGNMFKQLIGSMLQSKGLSYSITFKTLKQYFNSKLIVVTTALATEGTQHVYLSADTHPNLSVVEAIYMSACVPVLFKPAQLNGILHVDGALTMTSPEYFDPEKTLVLVNTLDKTLPCTNLTNYLTRLLSASVDIQQPDSYASKCRLCIKIKLPDDLAQCGAVDRGHNESKSKRFSQIGFYTVLAYMNSNFTLTMNTILQMVLNNFVEFYQSSENDDTAY